MYGEIDFLPIAGECPFLIASNDTFVSVLFGGGVGVWLAHGFVPDGNGMQSNGVGVNADWLVFPLDVVVTGPGDLAVSGDRGGGAGLFCPLAPGVGVLLGVVVVVCPLWSPCGAWIFALANHCLFCISFSFPC